VFGIVVSEADHASTHVRDHLLDIADWQAHEDTGTPPAEGGGTVYRLPADAPATPGETPVELRTFAELHVDIDDPTPAFGGSVAGADADTRPPAEVGEPSTDDLDLLVFASRHSGDTGALLTAHFTGNFGPATYGGEPGSFARACPNAQQRIVAAFDEYAPDDYEVGIECTHHGPTEIDVPTMFAELGSDDEQWRDPGGARAVARAILAVVDTPADGEKQVVGFGGGHYAPRFERVLRETDWAVGHIGADWPLDEMGAPDANRETLRRAFDASATDYALLEAEYPDLEAVLDDLGYRVVSETFVRETDRVPLPLVERLESRLCRVDDGLRFGAPARVDGDVAGDPSVDAADEASETATPGVVVRDLPADLLAETQGIDGEAVWDCARENCLAVETTEHGSTVAGRAAVRAESVTADTDRLLAGLLGILREKYDEVRHDEAAAEVVARRTTFDPEKAKTLGIAEGPAFGKLASGQAVEVGGRTIDPETVRSEEVRRFSVASLAGSAAD
jgi:D-aminoacyl-tRNA deacylase